jgi:hypothetical protein
MCRLEFRVNTSRFKSETSPFGQVPDPQTKVALLVHVSHLQIVVEVALDGQVTQCSGPPSRGRMFGSQTVQGCQRSGDPFSMTDTHVFFKVEACRF